MIFDPVQYSQLKKLSPELLRESVAVTVMGYRKGDSNNLSASNGYTYFSTQDSQIHSWEDDYGLCSRSFRPDEDFKAAWLMEEQIQRLHLTKPYARALISRLEEHFPDWVDDGFQIAHAPLQLRCVAAVYAVKVAGGRDVALRTARRAEEMYNEKSKV